MKRFVLVLALVLLAPIVAAAAQHNAFVDPVTGELKAHGFVDQNSPGDVMIPVDNGFGLTPHAWRWNGSDWEAYTPPPPPATPQVAAFRAHVDALLVDPAIPVKIKAVLNAIKDLFKERGQ